MKILANNGISKNGIEVLQKANFEVINTNVAQNQLENYINEHNIDAILVNNTTQITQELMDACPSLKLIGSGSNNQENIDVEYAIDNGLHVINASESATNAVAELVFAHLFGMVRFLHSSNREMPLEGDLRFKELNKAYAQGTELRGKTLGIIGFGNTGKAVAKIAIGLGMNVLVTDVIPSESTIILDFFNGQKMSFPIETSDLDDVLKDADFITLHIPEQDNYVLTATEFGKMKNGVGVINAAIGGILNEVDLVNAIENGKIQYAALDVFETEPNPAVQLLMNPEISLSPHIGGLTKETQERIGVDLANQIIDLLG